MLQIGHLPRYMCAKNYQNRAWFDKVIAKIKWCSFFLLTWYMYTTESYSVKTSRKTESSDYNWQSAHQHINNLVVMKLAANDSEGVVDRVLVDVYFRESLGRPTRHPSSVAFIIDHHRCPSGNYRLLAIIIPQHAQHTPYRIYRIYR